MPLKKRVTYSETSDSSDESESFEMDETTESDDVSSDSESSEDYIPVSKKKSSLKKQKNKIPNIKLKGDDDIRHVCIETIDENYSYGNYGEFQMIIMNKNGYMNATKLCKDAGKEFRYWKENTSAKELIRELSAYVGIPAHKLIVSPNVANKLRGSYVHPDLIPHIASWASPVFAIKVSKIVNEFFIKQAIEEKDKLLQKKDDKIDKLSKKMDEQSKKIDKQSKKIDKQSNHIKRLLKINTEINDKNDEIIDKIDVINNDKVVSTGLRKARPRFSNRLEKSAVRTFFLTGNKKDIHRLVIIKNNDDPDDYDDDETIYEYHALRVMTKSYKSRLLAHKANHSNMKVIMIVHYSPNSMNLWTRIKQELIKKKKIDVANCKFNLSDGYSKKKLIRDIQRIHNERFDEFDD